MMPAPRWAFPVLMGLLAVEGSAIVWLLVLIAIKTGAI
jgi:hypothetical protein